MVLDRPVLMLSLSLRVVGTGYSLLFLKRVGDRRFAFLSLMLGLMTARQLLTALGRFRSVSEAPGLLVSGLTIAIVFYLGQYTRRENRIKAELREANDRLRQFREAIRNAGHAVYMADNDGTITYVNESFESLTGYSESVAVGATPKLFYAEENEPTDFEEFWSSVRSRKQWSGELVYEHRNGGLYTATKTIAPVMDEDGTVQHFVAVQSDVTDRALRENHLQILQRILRHNLRNKLNVIYRCRTLEGTEYEDTIRPVLKGANELESLSDKAEFVNQTVESARHSERIEDVDTILTQIADDIERQYPAASVRVRDTVTMTVDASVMPAIRELVENGVVHNQSPNPVVDVHQAIDEKGRLQVTISDDGPGLPDMECTVLERGEKDQLMHSTGLGLVLAHLLVRYVGGTVSVESSDQTGTEILLTIPEMAPDAQSPGRDTVLSWSG